MSDDDPDSDETVSEGVSRLGGTWPGYIGGGVAVSLGGYAGTLLGGLLGGVIGGTVGLVIAYAGLCFVAVRRQRDACRRNDDPPLAELLVQQTILVALEGEATDLETDLRHIELGGFQRFGEQLLSFGEKVQTALPKAWAEGDAQTLEFYLKRLRERLRPSATGTRDIEFLRKSLSEIHERVRWALVGVEGAIARAPRGKR
jgi:hypothetical protein